MNVFELTRAMIDIDSVTPNEERMGEFLFDHLSKIPGAHVEKMPVEQHRFNVFAHWDAPVVTLSTHMDTVPPFFASREDDQFIWGRGACDTKGIIAAMITAVERMVAAGERNVALLFVVGEERNSAGAFTAAKQPHGSRFLINGEPTENKLALGSKGALRFEIVAHGKMAHSAYPHLGESAIEKLLDVLDRVRKLELPHDALFGPCTMNIGTIQGGRAPNVIPDFAKAEVFFRLVDDGESTRRAMGAIANGQADVSEILIIPTMRFGRLDGFETSVVSYATDIPAFAGAWGQPFLFGPGSIHVAHTAEERVPKREVLEAIEIYQRITKELLSQ
jgi:acetylornithine deacetylase